MKNFMFLCVALAALAVALHFAGSDAESQGTTEDRVAEVVVDLRGHVVIVTENGHVYGSSREELPLEYKGQLPLPIRDD